MATLNILVKEVKGHCPVFVLGDSFQILDGYRLRAEQPVCMHALASLMPYYVALSRGISARELGLGSGPAAYVQCLDPCRYTHGGTVVFEVIGTGV